MRAAATFKHSGSLGDITYAIPSLRSMAQQITLYLQPNVIAPIPNWAGKRTPHRMPRSHAEQLIPLLNSQPNFKAQIWNNEPVDYDLDSFRQTGADFGRHDIARYLTYAFPEANPTLHLPWLQVEADEQYKSCILVARSQRYRNPNVSYRFLAATPNVVFVGHREEYVDFSKDCPGIPHAEAKDHLQLARWIKGCRLLISNQTFAFSLAESIKSPRLLELYPEVPNVVIHGNYGADFFTQESFEHRFDYLMNGGI